MGNALVPRILHSLYGKRFGLNPDGHILVDGRCEAAGWRDPGVLFQHYDHFEGSTLKGTWITKKGSDGACVFPANQDAIAGGKCRLTTGANAGASMATNGSQLLGAKQFDIGKASGSTPLALAAAIQMAAITNMCLFVGFTNQNAALEMPYTIAGGVLTANDVDGFGFLFDTAATAATWKAVGSANSVVTAILDSAKAPVAATDDLLVIQHDGTTAYFYLNGTLIGLLTGCSRSGQLLTPTVAAFRRSAVSTTADLDYINAEQSR